MNPTASFSCTEELTAAPATALHGVLGGPPPDLSAGLPPLWHWVYLLDHPGQDDLGPDGHPTRGSVQAPPGPGLRRMWAGGRVRSLAPLRVGSPATRHSRVASLEHKVGRSGPLTFMTISHRITQNGMTVVEEDQQLVYRELTPTRDLATPTAGPGPGSGSTPTLAPGPGEWELPITPVLLFRFSALTYNAHRIHYDRDYARDVEGYPGLLVHGPLQALVMSEAARRATDLPHVGVRFDYRLTGQLFDHQGLVASADPSHDTVTTTVRDHTGRVTAHGTMRRLDSTIRP